LPASTPLRISAGTHPGSGALRGQGVDVPKSLKVGRINKTGVRRDAIRGVLDARAIDSA